jgi:hypothetical protein
MCSVIINIYNKKTKGPTLMKLFTATEKPEKFFFFTTGYIRCVHQGWHGTHRYDIQILATHASTRSATTWFLLAQTPSFSTLFTTCTNGLVCRRVLCVLCTKYTLHSNHGLKSCDIPTHKTTSPPGAAIFSLHTLASPSGRNVNYDEKQFGGEGIELFLLSVQFS